MKLPVSPAPALARGLAVLDLLCGRGPSPLEHLARAAQLPKPSVLRLLRTLQAMGAADREPDSKLWRAVARLSPIADTATTLRARCARALDDLCAHSGQVAELYALEGNGLRMIDRREPKDSGVTIRAQIGFHRDYSEVEAVAQVGLAYAGGAIGDYHWHHRAGKTVPIDARKVRTLLGLVTSRGWASDIDVNPYGVRRIAAPVLEERDQRRLAGVIGIAAIGPAAALDRLPRLRDLVLAAARALDPKE